MFPFELLSSEASAANLLEIDSGETLGLVGESGCGKSTAARSILQLYEPTDGTVVYQGADITEASKTELRRIRRDIQIVFQNPQSSLNPRRTIGDIIRRPMKLHGIADAEERRDRAAELIREVGLDERHLNRRPGDLSGGQQQRVAIARALINRPEILLADEPTGNLDQDTGRTILEELTRLKQDENIAIISVTHDPQLKEYTDRSVRLVDGVIQA